MGRGGVKPLLHFYCLFHVKVKKVFKKKYKKKITRVGGTYPEAAVHTVEVFLVGHVPTVVPSTQLVRREPTTQQKDL